MITGSDPRAAQAPTPAGPAYLLLELPSNEVVAESRPDVLAAAIAPGSIVKIATLIAAMEQGIVDEATPIACRRTITIDGRTLTCVHPDLHRPLVASEALGYSCNAYFATVAQRLPRSALDAVLVRMGLRPGAGGTPTGLVALGLAGVRSTPRALLASFLRVTGPASQFRMSDRTRETVTAGLRLAATTGTAAALGRDGVAALAKTGTAPMAGGGYQGIVVATTTDSVPNYAIVALVAGGAGADAAAVAADVIRSRGRARVAAGGNAPAASVTALRIGVARRGGGYDRVSVPIESYVARVVAGEMAVGAPTAALEALAITARTFAAANRGRHAAEGFELCDLTHCQVLGRATPATERASQSTTDLVLRDGNRLAGIFYSASCGGHTEVPSHVWKGSHDPAYLPARPEPACQNDVEWTSEVAEPQLRRVLADAGLRGSVVGGFAVATRYPSGRVATLRVDGMSPDRVDANAFQLAAGRVLGWQVVKSTLFDVKRSGVGFVLTGRGLGHGVGLCVRGAARGAAQGRTRTEILASYFPGLRVAALSGGGDGGSPAATRARAPDIRVLLPELDRDRLFDVRVLTGRLATAMAANLAVALPPTIEVRFHSTVESYGRVTGQPWWTSACTNGFRIDLVPLDVLRKQGTLESTLRHELVHVLTDEHLRGRALWIREGLAIVKSAERGSGEQTDRNAQVPPAPGVARNRGCPSDADFRRAGSPEASRAVYDAAGRCVARALAANPRWQDLR
jgi:stage II sporulation protein D